MSDQTIRIEFELPLDLFTKDKNVSHKIIKDNAIKRLAVTFYADGSLSLGKAAKLANISKQEFIDFLADHNISLNYDIFELEEDLSTVKEILKNEGSV